MNDRPAQGRLLWCDAEANCYRLPTRAAAADLVRKAKRANINTLIVDVKPLSGEVLYTSKLAPRLDAVDGQRYPKSFDLLAAIVEEGHSNGIGIHAAVNVFSEGHRQWKRGPAYDHPEWQTTMHETVRTIKFAGGQSVDVEFVDPWNVPDAPAFYTRRSGETLTTEPGRQYATIQGSTVRAVQKQPGMQVPIPSDGGLLSVADSDGLVGIEPGHAVRWQSKPVFRPAAESTVPSWGVFVNPIGPAREYELHIIEEIVSGYDIDGIIFDRMRYPNLYADFGPASRAAFEKSLGRSVEKWPEDIFTINDLPWLPPIPGKYYKEWLEWRAWQIRDFAAQAVELVHTIKPSVKVGIYVGSWYESYYDVGVNWGSSSFHPGYPWMTPDYNQTGFAELFDYICTGCYYPIATRREARALRRPEGATVEAACDLSREAIKDASFVYGSLYLHDYEGRPESFRKAVETALERSDGVMLFDLVYLEDYGWWPMLEEIFKE